MKVMEFLGQQFAKTGDRCNTPMHLTWECVISRVRVRFVFRVRVKVNGMCML